MLLSSGLGLQAPQYHFWTVLVLILVLQKWSGLHHYSFITPSSNGSRSLSVCFTISHHKYDDGRCWFAAECLSYASCDVSTDLLRYRYIVMSNYGVFLESLLPGLGLIFLVLILVLQNGLGYITANDASIITISSVVFLLFIIITREVYLLEGARCSSYRGRSERRLLLI